MLVVIQSAGMPQQWSLSPLGEHVGTSQQWFAMGFLSVYIDLLTKLYFKLHNSVLVFTFKNLDWAVVIYLIFKK